MVGDNIWASNRQTAELEWTRSHNALYSKPSPRLHRWRGYNSYKWRWRKGRHAENWSVHDLLRHAGQAPKMHRSARATNRQQLAQETRYSVHRADHSRLPGPYVLQHAALHIPWSCHQPQWYSWRIETIHIALLPVTSKQSVSWQLQNCISIF